MADTQSGRTPVHDRVVIRDVNTVGWHVARVEPSGDHHGWAFSVGFAQTFDHPEVAIFGLPDDVTRALLDTIGQQLRSGRMFRDGHEDASLAPPFRFVFRTIDVAWQAAVLPVASWFYGDRSFTSVQLFWPDRAHNLPWEAGFDPDLLSFQPLLFHGDATAARIGPLGVFSSNTRD
jgi:hypothetical protein